MTFTAVKTRVLRRFVNALTHSCLYHITPQNRFSPSAKEAFRACGKARSVCRKSLCGVAEKVFRWCGRAFPAIKRGKLRTGHVCLCVIDTFFPLARFCFADLRCRVFLLTECIFMHFRRYVAVARRNVYAASHICILCGNVIAVTE